MTVERAAHNRRRRIAFGAALHRARREQRVSAADLARRLGMTTVGIRNMEKGIHPAPSDIDPYATALGIDVEWLWAMIERESVRFDEDATAAVSHRWEEIAR